MKRLLAIVIKDSQETIRSRTFILSLGLTVAAIYIVAFLAPNDVKALTTSGMAPVNSIGYIQSITGTTFFTVATVVTIFYCYYINTYTLLIEKKKHCLESLLCTPLSLRHLWFGKTLAMFIPSLILGLIFASLTLIVFNIFIVAPKIGFWAYPGAIHLIATLIIMPLIVFFLSALFYLLQLILTNPRAANIVFMVVLILILDSLMFSPRISAESWSIIFFFLGIAAILALTDLLLSRLLTKERIILSSKG